MAPVTIPARCWEHEIAEEGKPRMPVHAIELADLPARLGPGDRLIGLDLGTKTIGVAVSDVERSLASPVLTIKRTKFAADADAVAALVRKFSVKALVIGWPLNMDGTAGPRCQATRAFVRNMAAYVEEPFVFWDERLSTAAVLRSLIEQDASRKRRAEVVDRMAAAYILQGALDRLRVIAREDQNPKPNSGP